jgi:hypothetical protein
VIREAVIMTAMTALNDSHLLTKTLMQTLTPVENVNPGTETTTLSWPPATPSVLGYIPLTTLALGFCISHSHSRHTVMAQEDVTLAVKASHDPLMILPAVALGSLYPSCRYLQQVGEEHLLYPDNQGRQVQYIWEV